MDVKIKDRKDEIEFLRMACNMAELGVSYKQGQHDSEPIRETDAEQYYNQTFKGGNNE